MFCSVLAMLGNGSMIVVEDGTTTALTTTTQSIAPIAKETHL